MSDAGTGTPRVSVIIPHRAGTEVLLGCLDALYAAPSSVPFEVLIVDNGSADGSVDAALARHPGVEVLRLAENQGFAGGCNRGIDSTRREYVLLLNDDAEVRAGWLEALVGAADSDPTLAALQPKIRSATRRDHFEYSGAGGGLMDLYGYPFSRGRLMDDVEADRGQYDDSIEIFWASGVCLLLRRAALEESGGFDELFFAYMEEIDLCWRLQLLGWRIGYVPTAVVHHIGGYSLDRRVLRRMLLNHRNSVAMLIKNYSAAWLAGVLPVRIALELAILGAALLRNPRRSLAVALALPWLLFKLPPLLRARRRVQRTRRVGDAEIAARLYLGMAPVWYFAFGVRRSCDLPDIDRVLHRPLWPERLAAGSRLELEPRDHRAAYLDQAPAAIALVRAAEVRALSACDFVRPVLDARCGDGTFARVLFAGWPVERALAQDERDRARAASTTRYGRIDLAAEASAHPGEAARANTLLVSAATAAPLALAAQLPGLLRAEGSAFVVAVDPAVFECFPGVAALRRLGARRAAGWWRAALAWLFHAGAAPDDWRLALERAGYRVEEVARIGLPVPPARLERLALFALCGEPLRRALRRRLLFPRLHRLGARARRALARGEVAAPAAGDGALWARLWRAQRVR